MGIDRIRVGQASYAVRVLRGDVPDIDVGRRYGGNRDGPQ
jgi:hypothetical protein